MPKISALTAATALTSDDLFVVVDATSGTAVTKKTTSAIVQRDTQGGVAYTWPAADGSASQVLTTNGAGVLSWGTGAGSIALNDLSDVTITAAATGDILRWNGSAWVDYADSNYAAAAHNHTLDSLSNVTITAAASGDLLRWNGSAWVDYADSNYAAAGHNHSGVYQPANATLDAVAGGTYAGDDSIVTVGTLSAGSVPWSLLSGIPGTFAPAAHALESHSDVAITAKAAGDILRWNGSAWVDYADSAYAAASHSHTASQITDFDTEVSNNADVAANTGARHAAATVSGSLDYITLTGQDIVRGAIDLATDITLTNLAQFDILYGASATGLSRLGGNVAATNLFLRSVGTGAAAQAPSWEAVTKTDVGLSNVENTALSTWAGSSNILTVGTIGSGVWQGTAVASGYGGTGFTTYATGDIIYASAANTLNKLAVGASPDGYVLTLASGVPSWAAATGGTTTWTHATTYTTLDNAGDNVGINAGASPAAKLHVVATTVQQRWGYDVSNYCDITVGATGNVTITPTGPSVIIDGIYVTQPAATTNLYISSTAPPTFSGGARNSVFGVLAGDAITSGDDNAFFGYGAGSTVSTGGANAAFGVNALNASDATRGAAFGYGALENASGIGNIGLGYQAGGSITTGTYNVCIGYSTNVPSNTGSYQFVLGQSTSRVLWSDDYRVGLNVAGPANGQGLGIKTATTLLSAMSGATVTATNLIPAGAIVLGVTVRVTTLITGATSFDVGDGTDVDRWGATIAVAANTTTTTTNFTAAASDYPHLYTAATSVVLTANGGNFSAGAVRVTVHYFDLTAATS